MSIGIAILTMNRPSVLERTLKSYKKANFLDLFDEAIILLQTNNQEERQIAEQYNLKIYSTDNNIGIGPANNFLIDKLTTDYFLICQNDFKLIDTDFSQITNAVEMIKQGIIDCYWLRSMSNPGNPTHGSKHLIRPHGPLGRTHACCMLFHNFIREPHKDHRFEDIFSYNEKYDCQILSSRNCCYTENPCVYSKDWYTENISKFNSVSLRSAEKNVQNIWETRDFKIGIGKGIFCHDDSRKG